MNHSYFRIKLNINDAISKLCAWNDGTYKEKIETRYSQAVRVCIDEKGQWKGQCLYVYERDGWTIFEDLSGAYSFIETDSWLEFADNNEFLLAGYNDAIIYAELLAITDGKVTKHFLECDDCPEENVNEGEGIPDIENWVDVASYVDEDELIYSEKGTVLIF